MIDLYSCRVVGWFMDRRMKKALVIRALMMAVTLRQPPPGLTHHSARGSQYASHAYQKLLQIAVGFLADLIVLNRNPLEDIAVFERYRSEMPIVMKDGKFLRQQLR